MRRLRLISQATGAEEEEGSRRKMEEEAEQSASTKPNPLTDSQSAATDPLASSSDLSADIKHGMELPKLTCLVK